MVRGAGLEPARYFYHQPLKLACLPFHHPRIVRASPELKLRVGAPPRLRRYAITSSILASPVPQALQQPERAPPDSRSWALASSPASRSLAPTGLEDTAGHAPRRSQRQKDRSREKNYRERPRRLGQCVARAARAENGLARAAEHSADLRALALLQAGSR